MFKFSASLLAISFFIAVLSSCGVATTPDVVSSFTANAKIESNDNVVHFDITCAKDKSITVRFVSPKEVEGLCYHYTNSTLYIEYKGLRCTTNSDYMPYYTPVDVVFDTLYSIASFSYELKESKPEYDVYSGVAESGKYTFYTDKKTGEILEISPSYTDCKISFSDISANEKTT